MCAQCAHDPKKDLDIIMTMTHDARKMKKIFWRKSHININNIPATNRNCVVEIIFLQPFEILSPDWMCNNALGKGTTT